MNQSKLVKKLAVHECHKEHLFVGNRSPAHWPYTLQAMYSAHAHNWPDRDHKRCKSHNSVQMKMHRGRSRWGSDELPWVPKTTHPVCLSGLV